MDTDYIDINDEGNEISPTKSVNTSVKHTRIRLSKNHKSSNRMKKRRLNSTKGTNSTINNTIMNESLMVESSQKCLGYSLNDEIWSQFPFQQLADKTLPFKFEDGVFHSISCFTKNYLYIKNDSSAQMNHECDLLQYNNRLNTIIKDFNQYLNFDQLSIKATIYHDKILELKLNDLNKDLRILIYKNKIDMFKRFGLLLAKHDIQRIRSIMFSCVKQKTGILGMIKKFSAAANHIFKPNKKWDDSDIDLAILVLKIGGPCLLYAFNAENRLPCSSFIYKVKLKIKI